MKIMIIMLILINFTLINVSLASLCGADNRYVSKDTRVAKLVIAKKDKKGCSSALIGVRCLLTAGHCRGHFKFAKFNTWASSPEDFYELDKSTVEGDNQIYDHDWAVFRVKANNITKKFPGEVQSFYTVDFSEPIVGDAISISGYGYSSSHALRYTQQKGEGVITKNDIKAGLILHNVDATHGNSGSGVILSKNGKLIAIHVKGGCSKNNRKFNRATSVFFNKDLKAAIKRCLNHK